MTCGCFLVNGTGTLHIVEGNINGVIIWDILEGNLISSAQNRNLERSYTVMTHEGLAWHSQSPDLNPCKNMERFEFYQRDLHILWELKTIWLDEWAKIEPQLCQKLSASYYTFLESIKKLIPTKLTAFSLVQRILGRVIWSF